MINSKTYKSVVVSLSLSFSLSGCMGIYEEGFECPPGAGTKCKSISEVNEMVNQGDLPKRVRPLSSIGDCTSAPSGCTVLNEDSDDNSYQHLRQIEEAQLSKRDLSKRVWWAPWVVRDQEDRVNTTEQDDGEKVNHAQQSI